MINYKIDHAKLERLGQRAGMSAVKRAADVTVRRAQNILESEGHNRTGTLSRSIQAEVRQGSRGPEARISATAPYAKFVEEGRGPIVAKPGKVLAFKPRGSQVVIFRKRVGPAKGVFFLKRALQRLRSSDFAGEP